MADELTADEAAFFQTGELPPALAEQHAATIVAEPIVEAPAAPALKVEAPAVVEEPSELARFMAEERERRVSLENKLEDLTRRLAAQAEPKVEVEEIPDKYTDPLGNMMSHLENINARLTATEQQNAARDQLSQFTAAVKEQKTAFEATTPDFPAAYTHIRNLRTEDLRASGTPESNIAQILVQDELQMALTAMQRGKNPAAEMYAMAKRYGYAPTATKTTTEVVTPEAKMAQLKAGAKVAVTLPKAGTDTELTFDNLKDASNTDLDKLVSDPKMWDTVMGGSNGSDIFNR